MIKQVSLATAVKKKHLNSFKDVQVFKKMHFRCILYLTDPSEDVFLDIFSVKVVFAEQNLKQEHFDSTS